jgi:hypothetical protein
MIPQINNKGDIMRNIHIYKFWSCTCEVSELIWWATLALYYTLESILKTFMWLLELHYSDQPPHQSESNSVFNSGLSLFSFCEGWISV